MNNPEQFAELRKRAEETARRKATASSESVGIMAPEQMMQTLHELQVHQIELEMQNEELRRTQSELDAIRERYFNLYDLAPVGYCTLSEKGMILESNLTAATLLGTERSELNCKPFSRFIAQEDQDTYYLQLRKLFKTGEPSQCELHMVKKDKSPLWVTIDMIIARNDDSEPLCRVALCDITKRKRAEEEKNELEAQLQQAHKMESVGRLAGGVAHDFNNMLGVILGYVDMALEEVSPIESLHADLTEIRKVTILSAELTKQLLAFSRQQAVSHKILVLNETVEGMIKMIKRLIGEGMNLKWIPGQGVWPVKMDPSLIEQILANLCINARDATGSMGKVTIETGNSIFDNAYCLEHPGYRPGEYVRLSVRDNGCGMDNETLGNVFKPFFTTKNKGEGTGLGLSMVSRAVSQINGFILASSEPGQETAFEIYLPRHL